MYTNTCKHQTYSTYIYIPCTRRSCSENLFTIYRTNSIQQKMKNENGKWEVENQESKLVSRFKSCSLVKIINERRKNDFCYTINYIYTEHSYDLFQFCSSLSVEGEESIGMGCDHHLQAIIETCTRKSSFISRKTIDLT